MGISNGDFDGRLDKIARAGSHPVTFFEGFWEADWPWCPVFSLLDRGGGGGRLYYLQAVYFLLYFAKWRWGAESINCRWMWLPLTNIGWMRETRMSSVCHLSTCAWLPKGKTLREKRRHLALTHILPQRCKFVQDMENGTSNPHSQSDPLEKFPGGCRQAWRKYWSLFPL